MKCTQRLIIKIINNLDAKMPYRPSYNLLYGMDSKTMLKKINANILNTKKTLKHLYVTTLIVINNRTGRPTATPHGEKVP